MMLECEIYTYVLFVNILFFKKLFICRVVFASFILNLNINVLSI